MRRLLRRLLQNHP
jgi:hypothetical protein